MAKKEITFPVGRLVQGNLYDGSTTDSKGQPRVYKNGPQRGQPMTQYYFAVAIPKTPGHTHWAQTDWGMQVLQAGAEGYPDLYQHPTFSWKIEDGDSVVPNLKGRKNCDSEGFPGNWILKFSSTAAPPRVFQRDQTGRPGDFPVKGAVKLGYYIQVGGNVVDNKPSESPGIYMNYSAVLFVGVGPEIFVGPDAATMFGTVAGPLPAGVLPAPQGMPAMPSMAAPAPTMPTLPAMPSMAAPAPTVAVAPNHAFLGAPAVVAPTLQMPPPVPVPNLPAAPAGPVITPTPKLLSSGHTYELMRAGGWTDDQLRAQQYIV